MPLPSLPSASTLRRVPSRTAGLLALALAACEPVQFGPDTPDGPGDTTTTKSEASLFLTNNREVDPGALTFLLYPAAAVSLDDATPSHELGPVNHRSSATLKAPAGRWRVAYETENAQLRQMPMSADEGTDAEWPLVVLAAGKTYRLEIKTDDGGNIVWSHNLPIESR